MFGLFGRKDKDLDELYDEFIANSTLGASDNTRRRVIDWEREMEIVQKASAAKAHANAQAAQMSGMSGPFGGGQPANQLSQTAQMMAQGALGTVGAALQPPPGPPKKSTQQELNEAAEMIGLKPDNDGFVTLGMVLKEVIRLTGIQKPMKKEEDLISALIEAKQ